MVLLPLLNMLTLLLRFSFRLRVKRSATADQQKTNLTLDQLNEPQKG